MRSSTNVAVVRIVAAAVFIGAAGLLVQSFAEVEPDSEQAPATGFDMSAAKAAADEPAFPDFLVPPVKVRTVEVPVPASTHAVPSGSDPRWARADGGGQPVAAAPIVAALPEDSTEPAVLQEVEPVEAIPMVTGSTSAAVEMGLARHIEDREPVPVEAVVAAARKDFAEDDTPARTTRITSDVRLRSRGSNASQVIGVIPGGAAVGVVRCTAWCEVTYKGKRGWVYSDFVSGYQRRKTVSRPAQEPRKEPAEALAEAKPQRSSWASRLFGNPTKAPEASQD